MNSEKEQESLRKKLQHIMQMEGNKNCADCESKGPRWCSTNLGIFVCMRCAGFHRSLGTHISKVKSVSLDSWTPELVENMKNMGNIRSNTLYLAKLPLDFIDTDTETFVRRKYVKKEWFGSSQQSNYKERMTGKRNLLTKEESSPTRPILAQYETMKYTHELSQLRSMGFTNDQLNLSILHQFNGDLNVSIDEIVKQTATESSNETGPVSPPPATNAHQPMDPVLGIRVDPDKYKLNPLMKSKLKELSDMGFTNEIFCEEAIRKAKGNVSMAVDILVSMQKENEKYTSPKQKSSTHESFNTTPHHNTSHSSSSPWKSPPESGLERDLMGEWKKEEPTNSFSYNHDIPQNSFNNPQNSFPSFQPNHEPPSESSLGSHQQSRFSDEFSSRENFEKLQLKQQQEMEMQKRAHEEDEIKHKKAAILSLYSTPSPLSLSANSIYASQDPFNGNPPSPFFPPPFMASHSSSSSSLAPSISSNWQDPLPPSHPPPHNASFGYYSHPSSMISPGSLPPQTHQAISPGNPFETSSPSNSYFSSSSTNPFAASYNPPLHDSYSNSASPYKPW